MLIEPKETEINGKIFILSKFPAVAGREIVTQYVASGIPKLGDYKRNEELMIKMMKFVAVPREGGQPLCLSSVDLINNHVTGEDSWETLGKLEMAMMEYNCSFFRNGQISTFFGDLSKRLPALITKMWTALSAQSSQTEKQL